MASFSRVGPTNTNLRADSLVVNRRVPHLCKQLIQCTPVGAALVSAFTHALDQFPFVKQLKLLTLVGNERARLA